MAFAGEAQKNMFFQPKTLIFDQQSQKYFKNRKKYIKIQVFLGFPVEPPVEPYGAHIFFDVTKTDKFASKNA